MKIKSCLVLLSLIFCPSYAFISYAEQSSLITSPTQIDPYTLTINKHYVHDIEPLNAKGLLNVVVEIPTGTVAKWEVDKTTGNLVWEFKKGAPRMVKYIGYPGNYGMVPQSLLAESEGGDGDPLDVIVLGRALPRGSVVAVKVIGVLKMIDKGEQDDKIIAVLPDSKMRKISSVKDLEKEFAGVLDILKTWFKNYKGPNKIKIKGVGERKEAQNIVGNAIESYRRNKNKK